MTPSGARWLYAHADLLIEVRSWAAVDRHELWLDGARARRRPVPLSRVQPRRARTATTARTPCPRAGRATTGASIVACLPDTDVGRRFPDGCVSHRRRRPAPRSSASAATSCSSPTAARAASPSWCLITAPATSVGLRITGQLVRGATPQRCRADAARSVCKRCGRGRALLARHDRSAGAGGAGVGGRDARCGHPALAHARRVDPPSRAARPRAVLRRRLGHARRLPGSGRAAARARARARRCATCCCASSATRTRTATGRSGSCSSSASAASARRLARRHRVLAAARARAVPARLRRCRAARPGAAVLPSRGRREGAARQRARRTSSARSR